MEAKTFSIVNFAKPYGFIYIIQNKTNKKRYIGQTIQKRGTRWYGNYDTLKFFYHCNVHLLNSLKKYGINNFEVKIVDIGINKEELDKKEESYILKYDTLDREKGYNHRHGGANGRHTEEAKRKLSEKLKGRTFSEETKKK